MRLPELIQLASRARADGRFRAAEQYYRQALSIQRDLPVAIRGLAELKCHTDEEVLELAFRALASWPAESAETSILHFAIAKVLDDLKHYESAWSALTVANVVQRQLIGYHISVDLRTMLDLQGTFLRVPPSVRLRDEPRRPVFIVGLPRSGSTLLERALSRNPHFCPIGESPLIPDTVKRLATWSEFLEAPSWHVDPYVLHTTYVDQTSWAARPLDKQLLNFCYLPLILAAFPGAKILHISRDPLASVYGIFRQRFPGTWQFAYSLEEIAEFYIGYHRLIAAWRQILPHESFMDVSYGRLVQDFPGTIHSIEKFLQVEPCAQSLEPEGNLLPVHTMSAVQVREPVHTRSIDHWRHYAHHLEPTAVTLRAAGISVD